LGVCRVCECLMLLHGALPLLHPLLVLESLLITRPA